MKITKEFLYKVICTVIFVLCCSMVVLAIFQVRNFGGRGVNSADVYQSEIVIYSVDEFKNFVQDCKESNQYYAGRTVYLGANLDFSESNVKDYYLGKFGGTLCGTYNGTRHGISGIKIDIESSKKQYLIGNLLSSGKVCDIDISAKFILNGIRKTTEIKNIYSGLIGSLEGELSGAKITTSLNIEVKQIDTLTGYYSTVAGTLTGTIRDSVVYAEINGNNCKITSGTPKFSTLAGKVSGNAVVENCYIKTKLVNTASLDNIFYAIAGFVSENAKLNHLYLEREDGRNASSLFMFNPQKEYITSDSRIVAVLNGVESFEDFSNYIVNPTSSDKLAESGIIAESVNKYWTDGELNILTQLSQTSTSEADAEKTETGESDTEKTDTGDTQTGETEKSETDTGDIEKSGAPKTDDSEQGGDTPISLTPYLSKNSFVYSNAQPELEVSFSGTDETVEYSLDLSEITAWNVGKYSVPIELKNSTKHTLTASTVDFEIQPYEIDITWDTKTPLIYNAKEQAPKFSFAEISFAPNLEISYQEKFTSVGEYTAVLVAPKNFVLNNGSCDFEIQPYEIDITWSNLELTYNGSQQMPTAKFQQNDLTKSIELECGGYATNAKSDYYIGYVRLSDSDTNFTLNDSAICHFYIRPAEIQVNWDEERVFEYNNKIQARKYSLNLPEFASVSNFYELFSATPKNVGEYEMTIKSRDTVNYRILDGKTSFEIKKYQLKIVWGNNNLVYNGKPQMPEISAELPDFCNTLQIIKVDEQTDVGQYTAHLYCNSDVVDLLNPMHPFTISGYKLKLTWSNTTFEYNGLAQSPSVASEEIDFDKVDLSVSGAKINQGSYTATASILGANAKNFILDESTTSFTITPHSFTAQWDTSEVVFDGNPHMPKIKNALPNFAQNESIIYNNTATEVGTHKITISLKNNSLGNFKIANPTYDFVIIPAKVTVIFENDPLYFNGEEICPKYKFDKDFVTEYTVKNIGKNAGDHTLEFVSESKNYTFANPLFSYKILPYQVSVIWGDTRLIYAHIPQKPTAMCTKSEVCKNLDIEVFGEQTAVGTYTATAKIKDENETNFVLTNAETSFTITPQIIGVTWQKISDVYDGNAHSPTFILDKNFDDLQVNCPSFVNCGEYAITLGCENANYSLEYDEISYTISPKEINVCWGEDSFVFDNNSHCPRATFTGVELLVTGAESNVGTHTATCESKNKNFKVLNSTKQYSISEYVINVTWLQTEFVYNGNSQTPTAQFDLPNFAKKTDFEIVGGMKNVGKGYMARAICHNQNYRLQNSSTTFSITPYKIMITWDATPLTFNGEAQLPNFTCTKTVFGEQIEIVSSGAGEFVGESYTATLTTPNLNFELENAQRDFSILPYEIALKWKNLALTYSNLPQNPQFEAEIPQFASDLAIVLPTGKIEVGKYSATAVIAQNCADAKNFILANATTNFEILPYALSIKWSDVDATFSGEIHTPTASFSETITFAEMPKIYVSGGAINVGSYTAIASIDNPNFTLKNAICAFSITPKSVEYECEQGIIKVSAKDENSTSEIKIKDVVQNDVTVPAGQTFLFGFRITASQNSAVLMKSEPIFASSDEQIPNHETTGKYRISLSLSAGANSLKNANLYLCTDTEFVTLKYQFDGNTIFFETDDLGTIVLTSPQTARTSVHLIAVFGTASVLLFIALIYSIIILKKQKSSTRKSKLSD